MSKRNKQLMSRVRKALMADIPGTPKRKDVADRLERFLNAEIPGTPRLGGRVRYVALPGRGKSLTGLTPLMKRTWEWLRKHENATHAELARALDLDSDTAYSMTSRLHRAGLLKSVVE